MKTTIIDVPHLPVLPCILRNKETRIVALFHAEQKGIVLNSGNTSNPIGEYATNWVSIYNKDIWEIVTDITINFKL